MLDEKEAEERGHKYHEELGNADMKDEPMLPLPQCITVESPLHEHALKLLGSDIVRNHEREKVSSMLIVSSLFTRHVISSDSTELIVDRIAASFHTRVIV